jgi:response regulator RpfG family c-di-GMP phosphodiesterase
MSLRRLVALQPHIVRVVLSASSDLQTIMQAVNDVGVYRYLVKPWQAEQLIEHVGTALRHSRDVLVQRTLADQMRVQRGELGLADAERRRLGAFCEAREGPHACRMRAPNHRTTPQSPVAMQPTAAVRC